MHRVLLLSTFLELVLSQLFSPAVDVKTLSELPLERLLQVRNNFALKRKDFALLGENSASPQALPLQSKTTNNRGGYGVHQDDTKGGKKGIQSIFQISVTTLAFLAFGGYLLCLIVQAIKGKQNYMMDNGQQMMSYILNRPVRRRPTRRRRPARRRKTTRRPTRNRKTKTTRRPRFKRELTFPADAEKMYEALVMLSEGYTKYHTVDYRNFNRTFWG